MYRTEHKGNGSHMSIFILAPGKAQNFRPVVFIYIMSMWCVSVFSGKRGGFCLPRSQTGCENIFLERKTKN